MSSECVKTQCKKCGKKVHLYRRDDGTYVVVRPYAIRAGVELVEHRCKQKKLREINAEK